nr:UDP-N-acetylglucosamine diphosphorylase/glucosamine-1-phosphate N-acetyltransferase [Solirubrobacterales bacterium]
SPDNAQGELYLPDVVPALRAAGHAVAGHRVADESLLLGVNDRVDLGVVRGLAQARIVERLQRDGVTFVDPPGAVVDVGVRLGRDTVVEPSTVLQGATTAGEGCRLGPGSTIVDARLGDRVTVLHSYLTGCELHDDALVGPFAHLRPGALLRAGAKAGTFVEIKNADIGVGTKIPHLSYVGDTDVGAGSNLGAATITANYDGHKKHRTTIGERVRTSVDTTLVAPVTVGDDAYTAAGSVITSDVPPGALGVARARQHNVDDYAERRRRRDGT